MKYLEIKETLRKELIKDLDIDIIRDYFEIISFQYNKDILLITLCMYYSTNITYIYYKPENVIPIEIQSNSITSTNLLYTNIDIIQKLEIWFKVIQKSCIIIPMSLTLNDLYKQSISNFINYNMNKIVDKYPMCDSFFTNDLICTQSTFIDSNMFQSVIQIRNKRVIIDIINFRDNSLGIKAGYKLFGEEFTSFYNKHSKHIIKLLAIFCLKLEVINPFDMIINKLTSI